MGKLNLKKHVWHKYVISAGILGGITAIALGSMYAYSKNSDDKLGKVNPTNPEELKNIFIDRKVEPKTNFVEIHNNKHRITYDPKTDSVLLENNRSVSAEKYLDDYYKKYHALPYLNIKYGSFNFYNQYIEAVSPYEFYKFTKWFMNNVSWGPEIITLKSFSIVKGVEMHGNSITLGSHANKNKEYTTIKFFPDAFFGTLPVYSELEGKGNAQDSLTYKINKKILTEPELQSFLGNIARYNAIANVSAKTINANHFRTISNVNALIGKKVFAVKGNLSDVYVKQSISPVEKNRYFNKSPYLMVISAQNEAEAREILKAKMEQYKDPNNILKINPATVTLEQKTILNVTLDANESNNSKRIIDKYLNILFDDGTRYYLNRSFNEILTLEKDQFVLLDDFIQVDKALSQYKNDYDEINERYKEAIRKVANKKEWTDEEINKLVKLAHDWSIAKFKKETFSKQKNIYEITKKWYLDIKKNISNYELEVKGINEEIEKLRKDEKEYEEKVKNATNNNEKQVAQSKLDSIRQDIKEHEEWKKSKEDTKKALSNQINDAGIKKYIEDRIIKRQSTIAKYDQKIEKELGPELEKAEKAKNQKLAAALEDEITRRKRFKNEFGLFNSNDQEIVAQFTINPKDLNLIIDELMAKNDSRFQEADAKVQELKTEFMKLGMLSAEESEKDKNLAFLELVNNFWTFQYDYYALLPTQADFEKEFKSERMNDSFSRVIDHNNKLNKFFNMLDPESKTAEQKTHINYNYYKYDIAYTPMQVITNESLSELVENTQLNWRDFYNLHDFAKDRKNILGDDKTEFFVYTNKLTELANILEQKNPDFFKAIDKDKLLNDLAKAKATVKNDSEFITNYEKMQLSIYDSLKRFIANDVLPNDFALLGFEKEGKLFKDENEFQNFILNDLTNVKLYLESILNGVPNSKIDSKKIGLKQYLANLVGTIPADKKADFETLINAIEKFQELNSSTALDTAELAKALNDLQKAKDKWNENQKETWFIKYSTIVNLLDYKKIVENNLETISLLEGKYVEYKQKVAELHFETLKVKELSWKFQLFSSALSANNKNLQQQFKDLINSFEQEMPQVKNDVEEKTKLIFDSREKLNTALMTLLLKSDDDLLTLTHLNNQSLTKEAIDKTIQDLNTKLTTAQAATNNLKNASDNARNVLNTKLRGTTLDKETLDLINKEGEEANNEFFKPLKIEENTNLEKAFEILFDPIFKILKEFNHDMPVENGKINASWYRYLKQQLLKDLEAAVKDSKLEDVQRITDSLDKLELMSEWHKNIENEIEQIKQGVKNGTSSIVELSAIFGKIKTDVSDFINNKNLNYSKEAFFAHLKRLKRIININGEKLTTVKRQSHKLNEEYFKALNKYKDNLASIDLIQQRIKQEETLKQHIENFDKNQTLKDNFNKYISETDQCNKDLKQAIEYLNSLEKVLSDKSVNHQLNTSLNTYLNALDDYVNSTPEGKELTKAENELKDPKYVINVKKQELDNARQKSPYLGVYNEIEATKQYFKDFIANYTESYKAAIENNIIAEIFPARDWASFIEPALKDSKNNFSERFQNLFAAFFKNLNILNNKDEIDLYQLCQKLTYRIIALNKKIISGDAAVNAKGAAYKEALKTEFDKKTSIVFAKINPETVTLDEMKKGFENLNNIIKEFNTQFLHSSETVSISLDWFNELKHFEKQIQIFQDSATGYAGKLFGIINSSSWAIVGQDYLRYAWGLKYAIKNSKINKGYKLNEFKSKIKEQIASSKDPVEKQSLEKQLDALDHIDEVYDEVHKLTGDDFKPFDESLIPPDKTIEPRRLFNSALKEVKKSEKNLTKLLEKESPKFQQHAKYINFATVKSGNEQTLRELFDEGSKQAIELLKLDLKNKLLYGNSDSVLKDIPVNEWVNADDLIVAKSRIELFEILTKKGILKFNATNDETNKVVHKMDLRDFKKDGSKLIIEMASNNQSDYINTKMVKFSVDANANNAILENVNEFMSVVGYKKILVPTLIKEQSEVKNLETGKYEKTYDLFADAYENLIDYLVQKVPYAAEWLEGPHIVKKLNAQGVIEYKVENGKYLGFNKDSRVGLWAILKMSDPNFAGISTDFLKFVGAHEYGHHMTLNGAQDLSNRGNNPIFVSALTPNSTPNINNYYSKDAVELYLKARTHVELDTKRLLDEFGVVKDYGEYATFKFPIYNNGKVSYGGDEADKDIWGVDLDSQDVRAALENKRRRFLQDYAGMIKAVEERRKANGLTGDNAKWISPFDLWIINAIDFYSGTLNPTVDSDFENAAVVKYMIKDGNNQYVFKKASIEMLKGVLKDGSGAQVEFEEIKNPDGTIITLVPKVVEGIKDDETGKYVQINKVLMKNKDGSPVVSVPLGVRLDDKNDPNYGPNALNYVNEQINMITKTIQSLIVTRFQINGWDKSWTRLDGTPDIQIDYPALRTMMGSALSSDVAKTFLNVYKDYVKIRDNETGSFDLTDPLFTVYKLDGTVDKEITALFREEGKELRKPLIYANPNIFAKNNDVTFANVLSTLFIAGNQLGNRMNSGEGQILYIDKDHQYIPNMMLDNAFTDLFFKHSLPETLQNLFQTKKLVKWLSKYTPDFIGINKDANIVWLMQNKDGELVNLFENNGSLSLAGIGNTEKLQLNYSVKMAQIDKNPLNGLFGYILGEKGSTGDKTYFSDYNKWLDFVSVDFSKAKYDTKSKSINWDVKYVKSKVDFAKFKENFKKNVIDQIPTYVLNSADSAKLVAEYTKFLEEANKDTSDQKWANEIMSRFARSQYAMFNRSFTFDEIKKNPDLMWIFDSKLGYGEFKKAEFKIENPDSNKWEISKDGMLKAFDGIAKKLDAKLDQLNLFDTLVFDNKVQLYTSQTLAMFFLQRMDLLSIFASLANATFTTSPTSDVLDYFKTKNERKYNEFFSDYTYNFAEVINRDNLQITYSPSTHDFGNMPSFLSGISESNTGLEYIVDGTSTKKWISKAIKFKDTRNRYGIANAILDYEGLYDLEQKYKAEAFNKTYKQSVFVNETNLNNTENYINNYFGDFQSINNGWFKDRWYRDILDFKLYDDKGQDIKDDTIRITDLTGKRVETRAKAYWEFYIQSQGVGRRNISSIWRNSDKDAVCMFGYLTSDIADRVNYIAFKDKVTGEIKTLKINKDHTDNMFYYKSQHILNEDKFNNGDKSVRHTLADEEYDFADRNGHHKGKGFVGWVSDYAIMSKYRDRLLSPGHSYEIYFCSDEKGLKDKKFIDLGSWETLAENGKTFSQAPIKVTQYKVDPKNGYKLILDANGKPIYEPTIYINDQFNGVK